MSGLEAVRVLALFTMVKSNFFKISATYLSWLMKIPSSFCFTCNPKKKEFLIRTSAPAIYMHEFWATVTFQKHNIKFKKFVDPPFEEEILAFMSDLGYLGNIKTVSKAQILYGMYHQKNVDCVYLLWEDLVYQIENKVSKRNKDLYYLRFTKIIISHFISQDKSIPRSNKVDWHMAFDDPILTTMLFIPQHEVVQKYSDDDERTYSNNDSDDFVHPKFSTHDQDERQDEENSFDSRVQTPSQVETTDDEDNDEEIKDSSSVSSGFVSNMLNLSLDTCIDFIFNLNNESTSLVDVLVTTIAEPPLLSATTLPPPPTPLITHLPQTHVPAPATQTNQFAKAVSSIPSIVDSYLANKMNEAIKTMVQLQSDKLRDKAKAENEDFINKLDDNIKKIIKDQLKELVKAQVSKILLKIKKTVNEQLEAEVLTRSSNTSETSHAIDANLSKLELKQILIDKMESNNSIHRYDEQKNLYKALVEAYESDKLIPDTYGDMVTLKRRRDDKDKDEEPFIEDPRESFKELMDTPSNFTSFVMNRLKVDTLTPELLVGPTFELMKGSCKSLVELEYFLEEAYKGTTNQLNRNNPKGQQYPHDLHYGHIKWIKDLVPNAIWIQVPDSYDKHALWESHIVGENNNNSMDLRLTGNLLVIDDDKLYTFKEGDFNRLCIRDIKDMPLLLVQVKLINLTVEERLAFNVTPLFVKKTLCHNHGVSSKHS
nr:hypothetical protein [Tanacetum cinerariifolium]